MRVGHTAFSPPLQARVGSYSAPAALDEGSRAVEWPRCIVVATDGTPPADAAVAAACGLAERYAASVELLVVHVPQIAVPASVTRRGSARCEAPERQLAARLLRAVRLQCRESHPGHRQWPLRLEVGDPVAVLMQVVEETHADLVVLGIGRPDPTERCEGGRTAVFAVRQLSVPVYAAAPGCEAPSRAVIVLPDGGSGARTIHRALPCVQPGGTVWFALPETRSGDVAGTDVGSAREIAIRACGGHVAESLANLDCHRTSIVGEILPGIVRLADSVRAQLIAVPVHGMPGPVRTFIPNDAESLLLRARCSVLAVPDESAAGRMVVAQTHD